MITGASTQLRALFGLRWQMIRSDGIRAALVLTVIGIGWLTFLLANGASALDPVKVSTAIDVAPQAFLGFGVLALIAPLTAGGGNELMPPDQLVAYPVRVRTQFLGGLLLAPINLVWVLQILALIAETAFLTAGGTAVVGGLTTLAFVTALTALGQAVAWTVVGSRQTRRGRLGVAALGAGLLLAVLAIIRAGIGHQILDHAPTAAVVRSVVAGAHGDWTTWALTTGVLVLATVAGLRLGESACAWALRRPGDAGAQGSSRALRRRPPARGTLRALMAVDRASVWRAPALRRGAFVLAVLPGLGAAGLQVPWESLAVLPGLVAAGAGLLFGINAFCLDGSGALFLASMPHDPRLVARAKALVLAETVLASVAVAALAGALRSPGSPTTTEVLAIVASGLACTAVVVSRGMASSVRRPHKADLHGPRDAVAPPVALAVASAKLAIPAGLVGILIEGTSQTGVWFAPLVVATLVVLLCWLSLIRTFRAWSDPLVRSRVVQAVSAG